MESTGNTYIDTQCMHATTVVKEEEEEAVEMI